MRAECFESGLVWMADFFLRPPNWSANNFEALSSTDPIFTVLKDQEASYYFRSGFALSNRPHLHGAYLVTVYNRKFIAVDLDFVL